MKRRALLAAAIASALAVPAAISATGGGGAELVLPRDAVRAIIGPFFAPGFPRSTLLTNAGDVNGDARPDLLFTNRQGHGGDAVRSQLIFGGSWPSPVRIPTRSGGGFPIGGGGAQAAGDVNRDGRADLVMCGRSSVVLFGRARRQPAIDRGFRIGGGTCAERIGDLDGDGFGDLLAMTYTPRARATVVFGRRPPLSVAATRPGKHGFRIGHPESSIERVSPVGDLNGDGRDDLVVDPALRSQRLFVVFGRRRSGTVDPGKPGLPAIVRAGARRGGISPAGDVNGDGVADLIFSRGGDACVIFGRRGRWPATTACGGPQSLLIEAAAPIYAVGAAGDLDEDGLGDVFVTAPSETTGADFGGGAVYVVFAREGATRIDLETEPRVVRITPARDHAESLGLYVAAGDFLGDGRPELVVGGDLLGDAWVVALPVP
jgi:hypothetical protein